MDKLEEHIESRIQMYEKIIKKEYPTKYYERDKRYHIFQGRISAYKNVLKWKRNYEEEGQD